MLLLQQSNRITQTPGNTRIHGVTDKWEEVGIEIGCNFENFILNNLHERLSHIVKLIV